MKKFFSLVAIATMVSFAACNNNATEETTPVDSTVVEIEEPTPTEPVRVDTAMVDTTTAPVEAAH